MDSQEYIRRDIEGSDVDTRRREALDLIKSLRKHYEAPLTQLFTNYVAVLLEQYSKDKENNWHAKDAAICIVTALAVSTATAAAGATSVNQLVDLPSFIDQHIMTELNPQSQSQTHAIITADALKFLTTFRRQVIIHYSPPRAAGGCGIFIM